MLSRDSRHGAFWFRLCDDEASQRASLTPDTFREDHRLEKRTRKRGLLDLRSVERVAPPEALAIGEEDDAEIATGHLDVKRGESRLVIPSGVPVQLLAANLLNVPAIRVRRWSSVRPGRR